ncbi:MAG TPA: hypothetical protein VGM90_37240 [Kofleriaceae bacterium]|jgi:hypothetical protein
MNLIALVPESRLHDPEFRGVGRLVDELRVHGAEAEIRANVKSSDDGESFLVLFDEPTRWMSEIDTHRKNQALERVVLFGCSRAPLCLAILEQFSLAAAVDSIAARHWRHTPEKGIGYGIAGPRDVVERIGGKMASGQFVTERYCAYTSATDTRVVPALLEYLQALSDGRSLPSI